jgi:cell division protein YceG involved in septum cleavage
MPVDLPPARQEPPSPVGELPAEHAALAPGAIDEPVSHEPATEDLEPSHLGDGPGADMPGAAQAPGSDSPPADGADREMRGPAAVGQSGPPPPPVAASAPARRARAVRALRQPADLRSAGRARVLALVALAVVVAAVVLLVKSLAGSSSERRLPAATIVRVVIPEGATRLQIAQVAASAGLKGSYRGATKRSPLLSMAQYGAPAGTHDLEGFLFPATYDMNPGDPVSRLVHEQLIAFRENFSSSQIARAHALHVTPYQLLTIASMVEREAKVPGDRPKIAAVIYNRLKKGMPLGIDATIYYALEMQKGIPTYTKELTEAQLQLNSPYNTRNRTGLPPTPIANPGVASIEAAAKPARVSYLYYVLAPDGCGEHVFSTALARFEANAAAYQAAVAKNGGAPPACKK